MTQRVSLDQAEEKSRAYFYHWFGLQSLRGKMVLITEICLLFLFEALSFFSSHLATLLSVFSSPPQTNELFVLGGLENKSVVERAL